MATVDIDTIPQVQPSDAKPEDDLVDLFGKLTIGFNDKAEEAKFQALAQWLTTGGTKMDDLYLQKYAAGYRGVHMKKTVPKDEIILEIPQHLLITGEVSRESDIGRAITAANVSLSSSHSYHAAFLIQELRKGDASFWKPYLDIFPSTYDTIPTFYSPELMAWLDASFAVDKRNQQKQSIETEYERLMKEVPEFAAMRPTAEEFCWARTVVISRIFGFWINGKKTDGLVPMADMFNHGAVKGARWTFDDSRKGFTMTSTMTLSAGEQVFDTYGRKCNSRLLIYYGFALENNEDNEAIVVVDVPSTDGSLYTKRRMLGSTLNLQRTFQCGYSHTHDMTKQMLSYLRFAAANDRELSALRGPSFRVYEIAPISADNEKRALVKLYQCAQDAMSKFKTTVEEDEALLRGSTLTFNQRNCVIMRQGEKQVLEHFMRLAKTCVNLLSMNYSEVKYSLSRMTDANIKEYAEKVVCYLVSRGNY